MNETRMDASDPKSDDRRAENLRRFLSPEGKKLIELGLPLSSIAIQVTEDDADKYFRAAERLIASLNGEAGQCS